MNCPNCNRDNPEDAQFCIYCATRLVPEAPAVAAAAATGPTKRLDPGVGYAMPQTPSAPVGAVSSRRYNKEMGSAVFLIGLGLLFLTGWFWPGILALIGITSYVNETARGRHREAAQGLIFFVGLSILFVTGWFWPGILIVIGLSALANRNGWRCSHP